MTDFKNTVTAKVTRNTDYKTNGHGMPGGLGQLPVSETVLGCEVWLLGPWRGHGTLCATFVTAKSPSLLQNIVFSAATMRLRQGDRVQG